MSRRLDPWRMGHSVRQMCSGVAAEGVVPSALGRELGALVAGRRGTLKRRIRERPHEAPRLLAEMEEFGKKEEDVSMAGVAMRLLASQKNMKGCEEVLHLLLSRGVNIPVTYYNLLLTTYGSHREFNKATRLFNLLEESDRADEFTYSSMMGVLQKKGNFKACEELFQGMQKKGFSPHLVTCNTLLWGCMRSREVENASKLLSMMEHGKYPSPNKTSYFAMVNLYAYTNKVQPLLRVIKKALTFSGWVEKEFALVLRCLATAGLMAEAEEVMSKAERADVLSSEICYLKLMMGYADHGTVEDVYRVMERAEKKGIRRSTSLQNGLLNALLKLGLHEEADALWNDPAYMKNESSYHIYMRQCIVDNLHSKVCSLAVEMREKKIGGMTSAYPALITAGAHEGLLEEATSLLQEMRRMNDRPSAALYSKVLAAAAGRGYTDIADNLIKEMRSLGFDPLLQTHIAILQVYFTAGDIDGLRAACAKLKEQGLHNRDLVLSKMISYLARLGTLDEALELSEEGIRNGVATDEVMAEGIFEAACREGNVTAIYRGLAIFAEIPLSANSVMSLGKYFARRGDEKGIDELFTNLVEDNENFTFQVLRLRAYRELAVHHKDIHTKQKFEEEALSLYEDLQGKMAEASERDICSLMMAVPEEAERIYSDFAAPHGSVARSALIQALCLVKDQQSIRKAREIVLNNLQNKVYIHARVLTTVLVSSMETEGWESRDVQLLFKRLMEMHPSPFIRCIRHTRSVISISCEPMCHPLLLYLSLSYISKNYSLNIPVDGVRIQLRRDSSSQFERFLKQIQLTDIQSSGRTIEITKAAIENWSREAQLLGERNSFATTTTN